MLRVAVWYESSLGRNDGNPLYVTSFLKRLQYFTEILNGGNFNDRLLNSFPNMPPEDKHAEDMAEWAMDTFGGIKVEHLRPHGEDLHTFGDFDLHIWVDWGEDGLRGILPYEPKFPDGAPLLYWASDTHLGYDYRFDVAKKADIVFCAQKDAVLSFKEKGIDAEWLPHCFDPLAYPFSIKASKKYDVSFVGHVNSENRMDFLDSMFKEFPNFFFGQRRFEMAADIYKNSKFCLNIAMKDDLNMRCFEVMGCGGLLLTDRISHIETLFEDKLHLLLYENTEHAIQLIHEFKDKKKRQEIMEFGREECLNNHTISHRVFKMLNTFKKLNNMEVKNVAN